MTKTTNRTATETATAFALYQSDAANVAKHDKLAGKHASNAILHFTQAVLDAARGDNYPQLTVTHVTTLKGGDKKETEFALSVDTLTAYANGMLGADDVALIMPTLRELTPAWKAAHDAFNATKKWSAADKERHAAHIASLRADLDAFESKSARTTAWRPITFAACVIADPLLDAGSLEMVTKGKKTEASVVVTIPAKDGKPEVKERQALSHKDVAARLTALRAANGIKPAKRQTKASTANADKKPVVEPGAVTVSDKSFSRDGKRNTADVFNTISHGLADMKDALKPAERTAAVTLVLSLVEKLDAEAKAEIMKALKSA